MIQGWSRPEYNEEYLVYVGSPKYDKRKLGDVEDGDIENPAPKGKLFLVFVLPDGTIEDGRGGMQIRTTRHYRRIARKAK